MWISGLANLKFKQDGRLLIEDNMKLATNLCPKKGMHQPNAVFLFMKVPIVHHDIVGLWPGEIDSKHTMTSQVNQTLISVIMWLECQQKDCQFSYWTWIITQEDSNIWS